MSIQWFGGEGQPPGICEVPLETFGAALDRLGELCSRLVLIGTSKGAEAALLLAAVDARVDAVVAFAPSHVVWFNSGPGRDGKLRPARSSWTRDGEPLPFVPPDDDARSILGDPPAFRGVYHQSLATSAGHVPAATIPVERIAGDVVLVAGEDDQVWDSAAFARAIADRRERHGLHTTLVTHPEAGHRAVLPGEPTPTGGTRMLRGGNPEADAALGRLAWWELTKVLPLS
nr:acyl-CoA thioester hydrolase/BAAT C-terminal domain-containing protein [Phytoactinopolyspora alkaliphila]